MHDRVHDRLAQCLDRVLVHVLPANSPHGARDPHVPYDGVYRVGHDPGDGAVQRAVVNEPRAALGNDAKVVRGEDNEGDVELREELLRVGPHRQQPGQRRHQSARIRAGGHEHAEPAQGHIVGHRPERPGLTAPHPAQQRSDRVIVQFGN